MRTNQALRDAAGIHTFADLFCGIGGFHFGAEHHGLKCTFASDIDKHATLQYEQNHGFMIDGDICEMMPSEIPDFDILFAGFPCQPFTVSGKQHGITDRKNGALIYEIIRILVHKRPKAFILENVRGLMSHNEGYTFELVLALLESIGYELTFRLLNTLDFGLPQHRERVFIVGFDNWHSADAMEWPEEGYPEDRRSLADILEDDLDVDEKWYLRRLQPEAAEEIGLLYNPEHNPSICKVSEDWVKQRKNVRKVFADIVREYTFASTLTTMAVPNRKYDLVNGERLFTPRERWRLQGFPDVDFIVSDHQALRQAGNAVSVPVVKAIIGQVIRAAAYPYLPVSIRLER